MSYFYRFLVKISFDKASEVRKMTKLLQLSNKLYLLLKLDIKTAFGIDFKFPPPSPHEVSCQKYLTFLWCFIIYLILRRVCNIRLTIFHDFNFYRFFILIKVLKLSTK